MTGGRAARPATAAPAALAALVLWAGALSGCGAGAGGHADQRPAVARAAAAVHLSTADGARRLHREPDVAIAAAREPAEPQSIVLDADRRFQAMEGWGAALTDAAAHLIETRLAPGERDRLLRELFGRGDGGIGLGMVRVPVGASDFSHRHYSYADLPPGETDPTLARFSIAPDRAERLPLLRRALAVNPGLRVVASPWSAPGWMKTSGSLIGGTLRPEHHGAYAEYLARWVEAWEAEGVPVFALTLQNEPHHEPADYPGMRLDPAQRAALLRDHVGPLFARRGIRAQLWEWDHNWDEPASPLAVLADGGARRWVRGVAWHCYAGDVAAQSEVHERHPEGAFV